MVGLKVGHLVQVKEQAAEKANSMAVEEMGDEWGRVSFRLDRELIEEYAATFSKEGE